MHVQEDYAYFGSLPRRTPVSVPMSEDTKDTTCSTIVRSPKKFPTKTSLGCAISLEAEEQIWNATNALVYHIL